MKQSDQRQGKQVTNLMRRFHPLLLFLFLWCSMCRSLPLLLFLFCFNPLLGLQSSDWGKMGFSKMFEWELQRSLGEWGGKKNCCYGSPVLRLKRMSLFSRKRPVGGLTWAGVWRDKAILLRTSNVWQQQEGWQGTIC